MQAGQDSCITACPQAPRCSRPSPISGVCETFRNTSFYVVFKTITSNGSQWRQNETYDGPACEREPHCPFAASHPRQDRAECTELQCVGSPVGFDTAMGLPLLYEKRRIRRQRPSIPEKEPRVHFFENRMLRLNT